MNEHSWLSDRTKTIIVSVTMALLIGVVIFGYYKMATYKDERDAERQLYPEQTEDFEKYYEKEE